MPENFDAITEKDLHFLNDLTLKMTEAVDEPQVLDIILTAFIEKIGAEVGAFIHLNETEDGFEIKIKKTIQDLKNEEIQFSKTVFKKVRKTQEAVLSFDTLNEEEFSGTKSVVINQIHAIS